jgi:hypothetical protein
MVVSLVLCLTQLSTFKIPHLVRVTKFRKITLPLTIVYLVDLAILSWQYSDTTGSHPSVFEKYILLGFPVYITGISIWRTWLKKS